jgi:hypothetical protein
MASKLDPVYVFGRKSLAFKPDWKTEMSLPYEDEITINITGVGEIQVR